MLLVGGFGVAPSDLPHLRSALVQDGLLASPHLGCGNDVPGRLVDVSWSQSDARLGGVRGFLLAIYCLDMSRQNRIKDIL